MRENGVSFLVDIAHGQKTGFFLDQREARKLLGQYSHEREVLNAFSYSGGFSMYALKAGAKRVHSVDISQAAVDLSVVNAQANGFDSPQHEGYCADVFAFLREMPAHAYDLIVLDPPAFAKHADAVKKAARGYKDINLKAMQKIRPGGLLFTFSCSQKIETELFRKIVFAAAADAGREARVLHATAQGPDHPTSIFHPEGEYLKGLVLQVD
jgi:23S rRNA (cytosine1962-C5)-methyltransferase